MTRYVQGRAYFDAPLAEGTDYDLVKDTREGARTNTPSVHGWNPNFRIKA